MYWLLDVTGVAIGGGDIGNGDPMLPLLRSSLKFELGGDRAVKSISIEPVIKQFGPFKDFHQMLQPPRNIIATQQI